MPVWYLCRKEANTDLSFWHLWGWTLKPITDTVVVLSVLIWKLLWLCFPGGCTRSHSTTLAFLLNHTHLPVECCFILIEVLQRCKVIGKGVPRIHLFLFFFLTVLPSQSILLVWKLVSKLHIQVEPIASSYYVISSYHVSYLCY